MLDNYLFKNIIDVLRAGLTAQNISGVLIKQAYQYRNQGSSNSPQLLINKLPGDHRYGYLQRTDAYDPDSGNIIHTERQLYESMFQIDAMKIANPADIDDLTASDLANVAAGIMQSDITRAALKAQGLGIYRITNVRNPSFVDERDRFEFAPSFDFTLQHQQVIISTTPIVEEIEINIDRV